MSWRTVVVSGYAKLDYKMDYLVVRKKEEVFRIHLSEIYILLLDSTTISITTALLSELTKKKIKVIFGVFIMTPIITALRKVSRI